MKKMRKGIYILCAAAVSAIFLYGIFCLKKEDIVISESYGSGEQNDTQETGETGTEEKVLERKLDWYEQETYLRQEIPELAYYEHYISKKSGGKAYLDVYCNRTDPIELYDNYKKFLGYYYPVFVDEKWEDHSVSWECFFVSEDFQEILWREIVECEFYSIEEWRATSWYKDRIDSVMEFLNGNGEL